MPIRFRLYDMGAAQGLLLDDVAPNWKSRIFAPGVYLTDLLVEAMHLSLAQREAYVIPRIEGGINAVCSEVRGEFQTQALWAAESCEYETKTFG